MENTDNKENQEKTTKEETDMNNPVYSDCGCKSPNAFAETMKSGFDKVFGGVKTACIVMIAALAVFIGCKSIPTSDKMYATSYAIGISAGMVANMTKIDDQSRNAVIDIMNIVQTCVPETNQTFEAAWTPIAKAHTQKLVDEGKIDAKAGELVMSTFTTVTKGLDYLFDVRYPEARKYQDLTEAAIHGFCGGFLTVFKPADQTVLSVSPECTYDKEAYEYLTK